MKAETSEGGGVGRGRVPARPPPRVPRHAPPAPAKAKAQRAAAPVRGATGPAAARVRLGPPRRAGAGGARAAGPPPLLARRRVSFDSARLGSTPASRALRRRRASGPLDRHRPGPRSLRRRRRGPRARQRESSAPWRRPYRVFRASDRTPRVVPPWGARGGVRGGAPPCARGCREGGAGDPRDPEPYRRSRPGAGQAHRPRQDLKPWPQWPPAQAVPSTSAGSGSGSANCPPL